MIEQLVSLLGNKWFTNEEMDEIQRNIQHIANDNKALKLGLKNFALQTEKNSVDEASIDEVGSCINIHFGDIIQELQDIQEVLQDHKTRCEKKDG